MGEQREARTRPGGPDTDNGNDAAGSAPGRRTQIDPGDAAAIAVDNKGSGAPVDGGLAARVGAQVGGDVSHARVHQDPLSQRATRAMGARAFAHGGDVFLGPGERADDTELMAHELTHVAQQRGATGGPQTKRAVGAANSPAEQHADRVAAQVAGGAPPARVLVDSGALASGQMTKEQFLALLRTQVTAAVEAELGKLGAAAGCPYIDRYFAKYAAEPAAAGEALIRQWIPAARGASSASALIPMVVARVREGVQTWQTAKRLPPELVAADPELAAAPATQASTAQAQRLTLDSLEGELGEGERLDAGTAARMSAALGTDVSAARIHSGPVAQAKAAEHDATAFAVGPNVVLGAGAPAAGTLAGDALLAHELAHTAQQKDAAADPEARMQPIGPEDAAAERDASLQGFAGRIGDVMRTGLQLQRCPGGGTDPKFEAAKVTGPDIGRKIGESHPAKSGWFNHRELTAGEGVGVASTEPEAIALAKMLAENVAIIPAAGKYYLYKVEGAGDLDLELVYGQNAGIKVEPGVLALVNSRGLLWRVDNLARGTHHADPSRQASADPFAKYAELQQSRGLKSLSEPELIATFEAAMFDTALAVLAASEQQARDKEKQFGTVGATGADEHVEIEETAKEALAVQKKYETVSKTLSTMEGTPSDPDTHDHPPGWEEDKARLREEKAQLALQRKKVNARYPMIGRYEDASDLQDFVDKSKRGREESLAKDAASVGGDCRETRRNIQTGDLNLWEVPSVVEATMAGLGLSKDQRKDIQAKAKAQKTKAAVLNIALAVFSIGFGIAAAVFTGGASLAFAAGAVGLGAYDAIKTTEEHFIKNAATNTSLDPTAGVLPEEMRQHWGWLVVAWAGVGLDIFDAAKAAKLMSKVGPEVANVAKGSKSITEAAEALAAGDKKLLEKLRKAAGDAKLTDTLTEAMRPGLSSRVGAEITVDGNLGGSVRVMYSIDDTGRTFVTGIKCGPTAKVGDILAHTETVRMLDRYSGLTGRARQLWDRMRTFAGMSKKVHEVPFPKGSRAFESWHELSKLDTLISMKRGQLTELLDKGAPASELQAQLRKEIADLENQVGIHQRVVDDLASGTIAGKGFVAMDDATAEALKGKHRLPDVPNKGAADITPDELKNSAWYFERHADGGFALRKKLDKAGGATAAPKGLSEAEIKTLAKTHDKELIEWANDTLGHAEITALFSKLDNAALRALRDVSAADAAKLLDVYGVDLIKAMTPTMSGRMLKTEVELLGERTAKGVAADKINRSKLHDLEKHANALDEARTKELKAPKELAANTVVIDANMMSAIRELMAGAVWSRLEELKRSGVNFLRSRATPPLPPITTWDAKPYASMDDIIGKGHDLRQANAMIGESATNPGITRGGLDLSVTRDSTAYKEVLDKLEVTPMVGKNKGAADRGQVADAIFAKAPTTGMIPTLMSGDVDVFRRLYEKFGDGTLVRRAGETVEDALGRQFKTTGFVVEITTASGAKHKLRVVPMRKE